MNNKQIVLAVLAAALAAPAVGAEGGEPAQEVRREIRIDASGHAGGAMHGFAPPSMQHMQADSFSMTLHGKPVKNAPYSAEVVSERKQTLADGNQITSKNSAMSYRDSAGRTRQEIRGDDGQLRTVVIHDEQARLILHPRDKTGTRIGANFGELSRLAAERGRLAAEKSVEKAREAAGKAREKIELLRKEGRLAQEEGDGVREEVIVRRAERAEAVARRGEEIRVRVMKDTEGRAEHLRRIAPMIARASGEMKYARNASTKDLGTREIAGVKAEGKLRSYEIPAGAIGNARPIVVSDETWFSPELQLTVYARHSDPRSGERIWRLENLRRDEPPAELFAAPSDYRIKDPAERMQKR